MHSSSVRVHGDYPRSRRHSVALRIDAARADAAHRCALELPRGVDVVGHTAKKISEMRNTGGAFGDVAAYLIARPECAQAWAAWVQGIADSVTDMDPVSLDDAADAEQEIDGREDVAGLRAQREQTAEAIREHVRYLDLAIARSRELRRAYMQRLESMH